MKTLVCDSNVLIDLIRGYLLEQAFGLGYRLVIPKQLYLSELRRHAYLLKKGLQLRRLSAGEMVSIQRLSQTHGDLGRYDLSLLVVAESLGCPLLTGDANLRLLAEARNLTVRGTIWLIEKMLLERRITEDEAREALRKMRDCGRRLPWALAEEMIMRHEAKRRESTGASGD